MLDIAKIKQELPINGPEWKDPLTLSSFGQRSGVIIKPDLIPEKTLDCYERLSTESNLSQVLGLKPEELKQRLIDTTQAVVTRDGVTVFFSTEMVLKRSEQLTRLSDVTKSELFGHALTSYDSETKSLTIYDFKIPEIDKAITFETREELEQWKLFKRTVDQNFLKIILQVEERIVGDKSSNRDEVISALRQIYIESNDNKELRDKILQISNDRADIETFEYPIQGLFKFSTIFLEHLPWMKNNPVFSRMLDDKKITDLTSQELDKLIRQVLTTEWTVEAAPLMTFTTPLEDAAKISVHTHPLQVVFLKNPQTFFSREGLVEGLRDVDVLAELKDTIEGIDEKISNLRRELSKQAKIAANTTDKGETILVDLEIESLEFNLRCFIKEHQLYKRVLRDCEEKGTIEGLSRIYDYHEKQITTSHESPADEKNAGKNGPICQDTSSRIDFLFNMGGASLILEDLESGICDTISIAHNENQDRSINKIYRIGSKVLNQYTLEATYQDTPMTMFGEMFEEHGIIASDKTIQLDSMVLSTRARGHHHEISFATSASNYETKKMVSLLTQNNRFLEKNLGLEVGYQNVDGQLFTVITFKSPEILKNISAEDIIKLASEAKLIKIDKPSIFTRIKESFYNRISQLIQTFKKPSTFSAETVSKISASANPNTSQVIDIYSLQKLVEMANFDRYKKIYYGRKIKEIYDKVNKLDRVDRTNLNLTLRIIREVFSK